MSILLCIGEFIFGGVVLGLVAGAIVGFIAFCLDEWL